MRRAIFITGPQASGKSTLARELKEIYGGRIIVEDPWDPMFLSIESIERAARVYVLVSNVYVSDLPMWIEVFKLGGRSALSYNDVLAEIRRILR